MAVAYPFNPNWEQPYSFSKSFKTGSAIARKQIRQRAGLRERSLVTIEYASRFKGVENSAIVHKLRNTTTQLFDVPDWRIARPVTDIASMPGTDSGMGVTSFIEFEITDRTDYQPIEAGDKVMVWQSPSVYFVAAVDAASFDSTTITLELDAEYGLGTSDAPASDDPIYCFKVFTCFPESVNLEWITDQVCEAAIRWQEASETPLTGLVGQIDLRVDPEGPDDGGQICEPCLIDGDYLALPMFDTPCSNPSQERPAFRAKDWAPPQTFFIRFDSAALSKNSGHAYGGDLENLIEALASEEWELEYQHPYSPAVSTSRHWHHLKASTTQWQKGTPTVSRWVWKATREYTGDDENPYTAEVRICIEHDEDQQLGNDNIGGKVGAWGCLMNLHVFSDEIAAYTDGATAGDGKTYYRDDPCIGQTTTPWKFGHPQLALTYHYQTSLTNGCTMTRDLPPDTPTSVTIGAPWTGASYANAKFNSCYGKTLAAHSFLPIGMVHFGEGAWDVSLKQPGVPRYDFTYGGLGGVCALSDSGGGCFTMDCLQVPDDNLIGLDKYNGAGSDVGDFDGCDGHVSYGIGGTSRSIVIPGDYETSCCYEIEKIGTVSITLRQAVDRELVQYDSNCIDSCPSYDAPWTGSESYSLSINLCTYDWLFPNLNRKDLRWYYGEEQDWQNDGNPYTSVATVRLTDDGWILNAQAELRPLFRDDPDLDAMGTAPNDCSENECPCSTYSLLVYDNVTFAMDPDTSFLCPGETIANRAFIHCRLQYNGLGFSGNENCLPVPEDCIFYYPQSPFITSILNVNNSIADIPTSALPTEQSLGSDGVYQYCFTFYTLGFAGLNNSIDCCFG
jgi:hypothetical protein